MTTGGTESILMALKTARDWARAHGPGDPAEVVIPVTAHPAFDKAAHYLGLSRHTCRSATIFASISMRWRPRSPQRTI